MLNLYLIRHGETDYNKSHRLVGGRSSHLSMNETGHQQAAQLGQWLAARKLKFHLAFCSTAIRAQQTITAIEEHLKLPEIHYSEQLEELSQGDWEGQVREKIYTPKQLEIINKLHINFKAPNGESQGDVERRMYKFIKEHILIKDRKNVLLVSHGTAIKCLLRKILDSDPRMTYKIDIGNTSISKISYSKNRNWEIGYINSIPHL